MKKVLFTASINQHIKSFHVPCLQWFKEQGYETHVACHGSNAISFCDKLHEVPFIRQPVSMGHFRAYKVLKKILRHHQFDIIHTHTPMTGIITRLAAREARSQGTKVLYTAHGFHFYKGSPIANWLLYYPIEKYMSRYTDAIITINSEDYNIISDKDFQCLDRYLIPGVGVSTDKFKVMAFEEKIIARKEMGYDSNDFIIIYTAEYIKRKNHQFLLESIPLLKKAIPELKVLLAGRGELFNQMIKLAGLLNVSDCINFLGFRSDIERLMGIADLGISTSRQEGLPLNLVELMMCGLPVVASDDRGHREIVLPEQNGLLYQQGDQGGFVQSVLRLHADRDLREGMGQEASKSATNFTLARSMEAMASIYNTYI